MFIRGQPALLYDAEQARAVDDYAITDLEISALTLMTRAGQAAMRCLKQNWRSVRNIVVVCGAGNNAGDGFVLARFLQESDYQVRAIYLGTSNALSAEAAVCFEAMRTAGVEPVADFAALDDAEVIVDALLGVGVNRNIDGRYAEAIARINESGSPVLSLDMPSGLDASTGKVMGAAVVANATISFITPKVGLYTGAGPDYAGQVFFEDLDVPILAYEKVLPSARMLVYERAKQSLGARARSSHKGTNGHALVVGGAPGFRGALMLAGEAAARAGAGLVTLIGYANGPELFNAERPELMFRAIERPQEMAPILSRADVVAVGPGLGLDSAAMNRFACVLESSLPLVVDADALRLLGDEPLTRDNWVLTPHPGEAAHLLKCSVADVQADRIAAAKEIQYVYGGMVILKGAGSVIIGGDIPEVLAHGNPGMGSGGMGDVLTGIIAALIAQGIDCQNAARLSACIHAKAGDRAALDGERGLLARDLMPHIRRLVN